MQIYTRNLNINVNINKCKYKCKYIQKTENCINKDLEKSESDSDPNNATESDIDNEE